MTEQIDLLRLSVLVRDAVLNSKPEYPITTFETAQGANDEHPTRRANLYMFETIKTTLRLRGDDGIDITIEASGNDAVSKLVNALSGV